MNQKIIIIIMLIIAYQLLQLIFLSILLISNPIISFFRWENIFLQLIRKIGRIRSLRNALLRYNLKKIKYLIISYDIILFQKQQWFVIDIISMLMELQKKESMIIIISFFFNLNIIIFYYYIDFYLINKIKANKFSSSEKI